jgi:hypothetical protein
MGKQAGKLGLDHPNFDRFEMKRHSRTIALFILNNPEYISYYMKTFLKLKFILIGLLIYQSFSIMIYSQVKKKLIKGKDSTKIIECTQYFDSLCNVQNKSSAKTADAVFRKITGDKLQHAANLIYSASDEDYSTYMNSLMSKSYKVSENLDFRPFTPSYMRSQTLNKIRDSLSLPIYGLVAAAYFFRIKVNNIIKVVPPDFPSLCIIVGGTIEEVFKGNSKYKIGNNVSFFFYDKWETDSVLHIYNIGQEYFVPLEPRKGGWLFPGEINPLALIMYLDKSQGFYPIENGYLIDTYNFFGFGKKIEYNVFDQNLRNKIAEIKSW